MTENTAEIGKSLTFKERFQAISRSFLTGSSVGRGLHQAYQVFMAALRKFLEDNCLIRANAIAYSIVFSTIPMLVVLVVIADVDIEVIRANIARFMAAYGMADSTEVLLVINEIVERATAIARIGIVIMIFSATNVLSNLEESFNYIYRASASRPLHYRFAVYIASLVILPTVIILAAGLFNSLAGKLSPPEFRHIARNGQGVWVAASDGKLRLYFDKSKPSVIDLRKKIDAKGLQRDYYFNLQTGESGYYWDIMSKGSQRAKIESEDFVNIKRISIEGNSVLVLSESGALFESRDGGRTWDYRVFRFRTGTLTRRPYMEDIIRMSDGRAMILATVGAHSVLLLQKADLEGWDLQTIDGGLYHRLQRYTDAQTTPESAGVYISGSGNYRFSRDDARNLELVQARFENRNIRVNSVVAKKNGEIVLAGLERALWTTNTQRAPINTRAPERQTITDFHISENGRGFLYGPDGFFRYTLDGGESWLHAGNKTLNATTFLSHMVMDSGEIILVGENQTYLRLGGSPKVTRHTDAEGYSIVVFKVLRRNGFPFILSALLQLLLSTILFSVVLALFVVGYRFLPNSLVDWFPALIGGIITSTALVIFVIFFRIWIVSFASTGAIYGVWAVVPVGMLVVLISTQIILFGLEVAYVIQHPYLYQLKGNANKERRPTDYTFWNGILLMCLVYQHFYRQGRPLNDARALSFFNNDLPTLEKTRELLRNAGLLDYKSHANEDLQVRAPSEIKLTEIQRAVMGRTLEIPPHSGGGQFRQKFSTLQKDLNERLDKGLGKLTVEDMLQLMGKTRFH